ncbi:hypothetical protein BU24DRAFT_193992 [Aaosphaeria arxii CBS 175.79]|uniref:Uncharacterized protein n=1 Tax=Aaosphaeria arxii CBS 175.79 TaxID=1450172 RepID=A0A6A5XT50_9PLEO|nr:uncharacterized protein BU24DRAFT_193992 [Aaosphaeria arxii CBS 175.79]KAF2016106.1 hypothetical protein BU24DRAFT_193992 [Aaosphaeria arxii CBS 175.79]
MSLADLLSNTLVWRQTAPYLPVASLYALAAASKSLHRIVHHSPESLRYLDLSAVKSLAVPYEPFDVGGTSWRSERMDESLTEDEFYSGPLRGAFSKLNRRRMLSSVRTLVLDGLSVPADLVREIVVGDNFNVRILSIREVKNLNERKLMQALRYAVRPTRAEDTPKVKGIYFFGPRDPIPTQDPQNKKKPTPSVNRGVLASPGAQIGAEWNQKSSDALNAVLTRAQDKWYQPSGRMIAKRPSLEWAETLKACEGIIAFDAVLCRGPRHDSTKAFVGNDSSNPSSFLAPAIATVALGTAGCENCHESPEGPAVPGYSPSSDLPLLTPVPCHSSTVQSAQKPHATHHSEPPVFFARCEDCLKGRWCERCNKWWDEGCYIGSNISQRTELQQTEYAENILADGSTHLIQRQTTKIIGVHRDCFGCGHTCIDCKDLSIRRCEHCRNEYCFECNDSSSATKCDWCNYTSRRTVEMY